MITKSFFLKSPWWPITLIAFIYSVEELPADERGEKPADAVAEHPGVYDQWRRMKGLDRQDVVSGLQTRWYREEQRTMQVVSSLPVDPFAEVEFLGPADVGGRTRAILIDRNDGDRVFAGAISGGLWFSDDRGRSWSSINDSAVNLAVSGIVQSPYDHNVIYYCTGEARTVAAGPSGDGLFRSTDGGNTFAQLPNTADNPFLDLCWCIQHSRNRRNTLYVGTEFGGLMKSTDRGDHWNCVLPGKAVTDVICFSSGAVLAAASGDGIYHSESGRAGTFRCLANPLFPRDFQRIEIAESAANPNFVYAAFESPDRNGGVIAFLVSADGGRTWSRRETPETGPNYNRYCFLLAVHPCDPKLVICGGVRSRFSRDGGQTWLSVHHSHNDYHTLATFPDHTNRFLIGNDGGVYQYRWSNPRAESNDLNHGYHVTQFYAGNFAPTGKLVIGGTQDNGICKLTPAASRLFRFGDGIHCHISLQNPNRAYAGIQNGELFRFDEFLSEPPIKTPIHNTAPMNDEGCEFLNPFQINRADGDQLYRRTDQAIWRTLDGGDSWMRLTSGTIREIFAIGCSADPDPVLYFGGGQSQLFRVDNAATAAAGTEQELSETTPAEVSSDFLGSIAIHPDDPGTILVSFTYYSLQPRIWKLTDADTADPMWINVSGNLPKNLPVNYVQIDPADPEQTYFAATDFGLYVTQDGGAHWFKEQRVPNVAIHEIKLRASDRSLFVFTHGRGVWRLVLK